MESHLTLLLLLVLLSVSGLLQLYGIDCTSYYSTVEQYHTSYMRRDYEKQAQLVRDTTPADHHHAADTVTDADRSRVASCRS